MRSALLILLEKEATHMYAHGSTDDGCHQQPGVFTTGLNTLFRDSLLDPLYLLVFPSLAPEQE